MIVALAKGLSDGEWKVRKIPIIENKNDKEENKNNSFTPNKLKICFKSIHSKKR